LPAHELVLPSGSETEFADRSTMPHFWTRRNLRQPEEKALGFAQSFLGVQSVARNATSIRSINGRSRLRSVLRVLHTDQLRHRPDAAKAVRADPKDLGLEKKKNNELRKELPDKLRRADRPVAGSFHPAGEPGPERQGETEGRQGQRSHGAR